jgi:hypothetical protein
MTDDRSKTARGGSRGRQRNTDGFEKRLRRVPLLGDADDPLFFLGICCIALATFVALVASLKLEHGDEFRNVSFKVAGGVLVALGAYTAVRTIISNRANGASQTFTSLLALLAADPDTADAARVGAIRHLPDLARRRGSDPAAIKAVIDHLRQSASTPVKAAAEQAIGQFPRKHEQRAPDHGDRSQTS